MPPLPGFSDNPFETRDDFVRAAVSLIEPLNQYKSSQGARIKIATATGAGFSETAAQLEGYARPLWVVADLLHLKEHGSEEIQARITGIGLETWVKGFKAGTDPKSSEYWGDLGDFDQRMVEMESIAYALLANPQAFSFEKDDETRKNLVVWLQQINHHKMPQSNWLWFRVLVNLALVKTLNVPLHEVQVHIEESFKILDTFYVGEGWSSDGLWCEERKQADYYSGSFAIQFAQLLFIRFGPEYDIIRTARYKQQAAEFAKKYWRYFAPTGAAIPFGRSLTYRFAMVAFWSAAALAGVDLPLEMGVIKGLLLRHLRWWTKQSHILNTDGTLNIGYAYPNMYLSEDYNSPQSVYWCLKTFVVLGLEDEHMFWQAEERPYPMCIPQAQEVPEVELIWPPRHFMCNTPEHTFLLSAGQSTRKRFKAREAKYGKFAYSSAFGFSVPCGSSLEQIAPDSTLSVSFEDGEEDWKVRWDPFEVRVGEVEVNSGRETVPTLDSCWIPWKRGHVTVRTTLVTPVKKWPGWSLRLHYVEWKTEEEDAQILRLMDGGFAASAQTRDDISIFEKPVKTMFNPYPGSGAIEGWWNDDMSALVISKSGASGVVDLTGAFIPDPPPDTYGQCRATVIRTDPNTNLVAQRSLFQAVQHNLSGGNQSNEKLLLFTFVTGIFAIEAAANVHAEQIWKMWQDRPTGRVVAYKGAEQALALV